MSYPAHDGDETAPFPARYPLAWTYHRNSCRWPHNVHGLAPFLREGPKEYPEATLTSLPPPQPPKASLWEVLNGRYSCRQYREESVLLGDVGTWLFGGYGWTNRYELAGEEVLERPVPSGGGLYPLEIYVLAMRVDGLLPGVYHYAPMIHALEEVRTLSLPPTLVSDIFLHQPYVGTCAAVGVITAVIDRSLRKYEDRGYRYVLFEAGHLAQNLNLTSLALGLGTLNLGGFYDDELARLLGLPLHAEVPLYGIALGHPSTSNRVLDRSV